MAASKKINTDFSGIISFVNKHHTGNDGEHPITKLNKLKQERRTFSDVKGTDPLTNEQLQYADLVQEGGGTLGIALVGYTFVLEYLGIRFMRLAGTSAGAINTLFLAAIGKKHEPKSPELFSILTNRDFNLFNFVDGSRFARMLIKNLIQDRSWIKRLLTVIVVIAALALLILPIANLFTSGLHPVYIAALVLFIIIVLFTIYRLKLLKKHHYGINPGKVFLEDFLQKRLTEDYHISSRKDLDQKAFFDGDNKINLNDPGNPLGLRYDPGPLSAQDQLDFQQYLTDYASDNKVSANYSFITADINHQLKVSFPEDARLYWQNPGDVHPALFVRASMAIPIFFQPFITGIDPVLKKTQWEPEGFDPANVADEGMFIDGGSLSNFPINQLHNPQISLPRMPIFGVRLQDSKRIKPGTIKNFADYAGRIINTLRSQEDKIFLRKNRFYQKHSIKEIAVFETKISWLDFNLSEKQQAKLFLAGVNAALDFIEHFSWPDYRRERIGIGPEEMKKVEKKAMDQRQYA